MNWYEYALIGLNIAVITWDVIFMMCLIVEKRGKK